MVTAARRTTKEPALLQTVWADGDYCLAIPPQAHTYKGFLKWVMSDEFPEKLHVALIDGDISLDMSSECLNSHLAVRMAVGLTLHELVTNNDLGEFYGAGVMLGNRETELSNNPDGMAVLWDTFLQRRVRFIRRKGDERAIEGAPDWVLEVVSDASVTKDTIRLRKAYHRARVREYWLVDARGSRVQFQILTWRPTSYVAVPSKNGWMSSQVFSQSFRLTRQRNRIGHWTYTLAARREPSKPKTK